MKRTQVPAEVHQLATSVGNFMHYWGFKRVHGRIWTLLVLSESPLDAHTIGQDLKISKALVSISLAELLKFGVIERAGKARRGTTLYRPCFDVIKPILGVLRSREKKILSDIISAIDGVDKMPAESRQEAGVCASRLLWLSAFTKTGATALDSLLDTMTLNLDSLTHMPAEPERISSSASVS